MSFDVWSRNVIGGAQNSGPNFYLSLAQASVCLPVSVHK